MCAVCIVINEHSKSTSWAYDSHAGHCDTVVPTCSCPEVTPSLHHYFLIRHPPPLPSHRVVNKGRHVVQWSTCRRRRGSHKAPFFSFWFLWWLTISKSASFFVFPKHAVYAKPSFPKIHLPQTKRRRRKTTSFFVVEATSSSHSSHFTILYLCDCFSVSRPPLLQRAKMHKFGF